MTATRTPALAPEVEKVVDAVAAMAGAAFEVVDAISALVQARFASGGAPSRGTLGGVDELCAGYVGDPDHPVRGAGYVAAVGYLADEPWWLEWFTQGEDGRSHRMVCQTDPDGVGFFDYEFLTWYVVPRDTGRRHVTGPYIDYLCTDDYNMTYTAPVLVDGRFAGVAGADIGVQTAEKLLLPTLRVAGRPLAVVNEQGRIVASNSGRHLCGDLVTELDVPGAWPASARAASGLHVVGELPLAVLEL
ncbi:cache domain-containing protein [Nocardioides sp. MH1]|uniref:cache domain-containing protein n=1 Tax=Nocardioides sp. MH1 TaxID=3242490 RepID=UPI0035203289